MSFVSIARQNTSPNPAINLNTGFELWDTMGPGSVAITKAVPLRWTLFNATATRNTDGSMTITRTAAGSFGIQQDIGLSKIALRGKNIALSIATSATCDGVLSIDSCTEVIAPTINTTANSAVYKVPDTINVSAPLVIKLTLPGTNTSCTTHRFKAEIGNAPTRYVAPPMEAALVECGVYNGVAGNLDVTGLTINLNTLRPANITLRLICHSAVGAANITTIPRTEAFSIDIEHIQGSSPNHTCLQRITYQNGDTYTRRVPPAGNPSAWAMGSAITEMNTGKETLFWVGTKVEYDAIATKNPNTLYEVTDIDNSVLNPTDIGAAVVGHNHDTRYPSKSVVDGMMVSGVPRIDYTIAPRNSTMSLSTTTALSSTKRALAAAKDGNGNVLFGGGYNGSYLATVDSFTPSGTKTVLTALSAARCYLAASADGAGNVLFGGGDAKGNASAVVDKYAPGGTRTTLTVLPIARLALTAAKDGNGNVLFGGGQSSAGAPYANVDRYSTDGTVAALTALSAARTSLAAATDSGGNVLFGGGYATGGTSSSIVDKYTSSGVRSSLSALSIARGNLAAATDGAGNVLFGGGLDSLSASRTEVDVYSPSGSKGSRLPLLTAMYNLTAATDGDGNVLFGGGGGSNTHISAVYRYSPDGTRTTLTPLTVARSQMGMVTDGNGNVLFGGGDITTGSVYTATVEKYTLVQPAPASIKVSVGSTYKFNEHTVEQVATTETISVNTKGGNSGYVKHKGTVTI